MSQMAETVGATELNAFEWRFGWASFFRERLTDALAHATATGFSAHFHNSAVTKTKSGSSPPPPAPGCSAISLRRESVPTFQDVPSAARRDPTRHEHAPLAVL